MIDAQAIVPGWKVNQMPLRSESGAHFPSMLSMYFDHSRSEDVRFSTVFTVDFLPMTLRPVSEVLGGFRWWAVVVMMFPLQVVWFHCLLSMATRRSLVQRSAPRESMR